MEITAKKRRKGIDRIYSQYIEWYFDDRNIELSGVDMEYFTNSLINNGIEGELYAREELFAAGIIFNGNDF